MFMSNSSSTYKCPMCPKGFRLLIKYKQHVKMHKIKNSLRCQYCGDSFCTVLQYKMHVRTHMNVYNCDFCNKSFSRTTDKEEHIKINHNPLRTRIQGRQHFNNREDCSNKKEFIKQTIVDDKTEHSYTCKTCQRTFTQIQTFNDHILSHIEGKQLSVDSLSNFDCEFCDKSFSVSSDYIQHMRVHVDESSFSCELCGECFDRVTDADTHLCILKTIKTELTDVCVSEEITDEHHEDDKKKVLEMTNDLGQLFHEQHNLTDEALIDDYNNCSEYNENQNRCELCDVICHTLPDYKEHLKTHTTDVVRTEIDDRSHSRTPDEIVLVDDKVQLDEVSLKPNFELVILDGKETYIVAQDVDCDNRGEEDKEGLNMKTCGICAEKFDSVSECRHHIERHMKTLKKKNELRHTCPFCWQRFDTARSLTRHMSTAHMTDACHRCHVCHEVFANSADRKKHVLSAHGLESDFTTSKQQQQNCTDTNDVHVIEVDALHAHRYESDFTTSKQQQQNCTDTNDVHVIEVDALHAPGHESDFTTSKQQHNNSSDTNDVHVIEVVDSEVGIGHDDNIDDDDDGGSMMTAECCDLCGDLFGNIDDLKVHIRVHTGEALECYLCRAVFVDSDDYRSHMDTEHVGEGLEEELLYLCGQCGKSFEEMADYKRHVNRQHQPRNVICPTCGKGFRSTHNLKIHDRIHTQSRPYQCRVCSKSFTQISSHAIHMRIHTGERPYQCGVCGKSFNQTGHHRTHMRIHTGQRPFECSLCGKTFSDYGNYIKHTRLHTGDQPYKCAECGKGFSRRKRYELHMASSH